MGEDEGVELIFVSCDRSKADMISYMKESHGDWFGVEHGSDLVQQLSEIFGVSGIPYLVVVKSDGTLITKDGRSAFKGKGLLLSNPGRNKIIMISFFLSFMFF